MTWIKKLLGIRRLKCKECGHELQQRTVPTCSGRCHGTEVSFSGIPLLRCSEDDHPARYADPDFGHQLIEEIFWGDAIPVAHPKAGYNLRCLKCEKPLDSNTGSPVSVSGKVNLGKLPEFGITIKALGTLCKHCRTLQIWANDDVGNEISEAILEAFNSIELTP